MKNRRRFLWAIVLNIIIMSCSSTTDESKTEVWLTNLNESSLFEKQAEELVFEKFDNSLPFIEVDSSHSFQTMDGFGFTLTGGSAMVLNRMDSIHRIELLKNLFGTEGSNIGISYLRISIGASDLDNHVFSYNDLLEGEEDMLLEKFSIEEDRKNLIPIIKEIQSINPSIKFMGSPWSAPKWMKTNNDTKGGSLKLEFYESYANYLVKYINSYKNEGILLDMLTIQNEPLHPGNNPSMYMEASKQANFIKNYLGPAFRKEGIRTKIVIYDHNLDRIDYPISILNDKEAAKYIDGTAFHLYGGTIDEMGKVHKEFPNKNLYFTEQWIGDLEGQNTIKDVFSWHIKNLIIGAPKNWSRVVLEWNLASDENLDPHTDRGGCDKCIGAISLQGNRVRLRPAYYIIAHASKFVRPGSVRIHSSCTNGLETIAYKTPSNQTVLIVLNEAQGALKFSVKVKGLAFKTSLNQGSVATYVW